ncbi:hypothetical protein GJ744_007345 [Endocarpon pusillum]|uniref:Major facilitator superfamily (MFS) profile domain-containing protein n=1 Tax=Endocarpon pusillum TaxID=364733 RepID=A0A8H7AKJ4_9EURO|nr:hypothetical protein GJ744_007345 [Endocarpon pusillum]
MPELEKTQSERGWRRPRTTSIPSRPRLERLYSGQHLDDHSYYHHDDHEYSDDGNGLNTLAIARLEDDTSEDGVADRIGEDAGEVQDGVPDKRDLESGGPPLEKKSTTRSVKAEYLVTWDGPDDSANPKNWTFQRKWAATFIVSSFTFISPVSSSMVAPALQSIAMEFNITNDVEIALTLSIFVLAYAIGPLFLGPMSEIYGRVHVLQLSNLFYLVFNIACGVCTSKGQLLAFRFLSGLGGSGPLAIGGGVLSDCWKAEERGKAISLYSLAPLLGPAIGPIAGGFIVENTTWRWAFYATSIADALIQISGLFFLQETYGPRILHIKAERIRKDTGNTEFKTEFEHPERTLWNTLKRSIGRPFRLLGTQPIVQCLALYIAFVYGLMYLVLSTFPALWERRYNESVGIAGLNYISLGLGFFLGAQICAPINDQIWCVLKNRNNDTGKPEFRVPMMVPGAVLVPVGLFCYGWSAQARVHWIVPNIGACIFAAGTIISFQCIQTYIVDAYTRYAASGIAAATVLRSLAGFGFPLFAPYMYNALDYGWGNTLLAFIAIALGIPAPFMLWKYGAKLRARSKFAAGG